MPLLRGMTFSDHAARLRLLDARLADRMRGKGKARLIAHADGHTIRFVDPKKPASDVENVTALIGARAGDLTDEYVGSLELEARKELLAALQSGGALGGADDALFARLEASLKSRSEKAARARAIASVAATLGLGRSQEAAAVAKDEGIDILAWNTTMLDRNVCEFCIAAETHTSDAGGVPFGSEEQQALAPPLKPNAVTGDGCEGVERCRCIQVFQRADNAVNLPP